MTSLSNCFHDTSGRMPGVWFATIERSHGGTLPTVCRAQFASGLKTRHTFAPNRVSRLIGCRSGTHGGALALAP
jgi:hypothetical protein